MNKQPEQRLYLQRITKDELDGAMISRAALGALDFLITVAAGRLTSNSSDYVVQGDRVTMRRRHVEAAVRMISNGEMVQACLDTIDKAVATYARSRGEGDTSVSKTQAAGLILSTPRVERAIRQNMTCNNLGEEAVIAMTGALETVARCIVRTAVECATEDRKRKKITPRYIMLALRKDPDLAILFKRVRVAAAGVPPPPEVARRPPPRKRKRPPPKTTPRKKPAK